MLIFEEGGKPENPEKNPRSKGENQQQTQPTYDAGSGNRTRDTLVGGERSQDYATPAPQHYQQHLQSTKKVAGVITSFHIHQSFQNVLS